MIYSACMDLSPKEREVAAAIHRGLPRKEIAHALGISQGTLQNYVASIYRKLDINDQRALVLWVEREKVAAK